MTSPFAFLPNLPVLLLAAGIAAAQAPTALMPPPAPTSSLNLHDLGPGETLHVTVGHSMVLRGDTPMRRIYVGNPAVLQSFTAGPAEVVLTAKSSGLSSLVVWDVSGKSSLYTVAADLDPVDLRRSLHDAFPQQEIDVESREGRIYLTGSVPTQEVSDGAAKLTASYTKDLVNSLRIVPIHPKQVQLKLRIIEVDRTRMEQYGINFFAGGKVPLSVTTGQFPSSGTITPGTGGQQSTASITDPLNLFLYSSSLNLGATVKDLEQKSILQVLAEPTLSALSGQSAKFLSGGEFPFPVVQGGGSASGVAITIQFRPYGVKVDFTPTVNEDGTIRLKVAPEVSALDYSNSVSISGFTIPALSTRRAETEVEILNGQSFALTGLLDHRTSENLSQLPGISSLPILGKLFVTKSYTHSVVELIVLVTATVVDPTISTPLPPQPQMVVPNMDAGAFDEQLSHQQKLPPRHP